MGGLWGLVWASLGPCWERRLFWIIFTNDPEERVKYQAGSTLMKLNGKELQTPEKLSQWQRRQ